MVRSGVEFRLPPPEPAADAYSRSTTSAGFGLRRRLESQPPERFATKRDRIPGAPVGHSTLQRRRIGWRPVLLLEPEHKSHSVLPLPAGTERLEASLSNPASGSVWRRSTGRCLAE